MRKAWKMYGPEVWWMQFRWNKNLHFAFISKVWPLGLSVRMICWLCIYSCELQLYHSDGGKQCEKLEKCMDLKFGGCNFDEIKWKLAFLHLFQKFGHLAWVSGWYGECQIAHVSSSDIIVTEESNAKSLKNVWIWSLVDAISMKLSENLHFCIYFKSLATWLECQDDLLIVHLLMWAPAIS